MPWIGDLFKGAFLLGDGTWWGLREKISEKRLLDQEGRDRNNGITLVEAQAVYHCMQTEGPEVGKEAIMKLTDIYLLNRVPPSKNRHYTYNGLCGLAIYGPAVVTQQEIAVLELLNKQKCSCVPKLYAWVLAGQTEEMIIPGAYIVVLVMEKLPGVPLWDYWSREPEQRRRTKEGFKEALSEVFSHGVIPWDRRPTNIIYNETNDKVYLIDFEQAEIKIDKEYYGVWADWEWQAWCLGEVDEHGNEIIQTRSNSPFKRYPTPDITT